MKENDFLFGVATASVQIEGGAFQDGKGKSVWDYYSEKGGIFRGQNCYTCCDSYNRLDEDLALIKGLGLNAYRFSISWPRIQPLGSGELNQKGIDYYNRLIDGLLAIGVKPFITLFHWDLPLPIHEQGGFLNRDLIVERFSEYGKIIAELFSDRVEMFSVFNEAAAIIDFMYLQPVGKIESAKTQQEAFEGVHNLLLANAAATYSLRKYAKQPVRIGMVNCSNLYAPYTESKEDIEAARKATFAISDNLIGSTNTFWHPIMFGEHDKRLVEKFNLDTSFIRDGDMDYIMCKPDFMGCNVYNGETVRADENGNPVLAPHSLNAVNYSMGYDPAGMAGIAYWGIKFMSEHFGLPIYITESGTDLPDLKDRYGKVSDPVRGEIIYRYCSNLLKAKDEGIDVRGYFAWTLMDNFEWSSGFTRRFGLVYTDFETLERTPKQSYYEYRDMIDCYKKTGKLM